LAELRSQISFQTAATDDDFVLERLSAELAEDLRDVGEVSYSTLEAQPGDKGIGEVAVATLSVLTAVDPAQLEAMIQILSSFTKRNAGRRVQMRVGEVELTIDRPTDAQVDTILKTVQNAVDRQQI
jgi:hypothetical protein